MAWASHRHPSICPSPYKKKKKKSSWQPCLSGKSFIRIFQTLIASDAVRGSDWNGDWIIWLIYMLFMNLNIIRDQPFRNFKAIYVFYFVPFLENRSPTVFLAPLLHGNYVFKSFTFAAETSSKLRRFVEDVSDYKLLSRLQWLETYPKFPKSMSFEIGHKYFSSQGVWLSRH